MTQEALPAEPLPADQTHVPFDVLVSRIERTLIAAGSAPEAAAILARNCASCERDGTHSHGVFRMRGYVHSLTTGWADGRAEPSVERVGASYVRIDAANGFTQPALAKAAPEIDDALETTGVAVVAVREGHHFSALWPDLEAWADRGYVALGMITAGKLAVMPKGVGKHVFSTNPFGFATPVEGAPPVVFDYATSSISHGDLQLYRREGRKVPPGTGVDRNGEETDDPNEILTEGGILPFGGHKGALFSFMIEVFASGLTGGSFTYELDKETPEGAHTFRTGQLFIVIDPERGGNEVFEHRVAAFVEMLREAGMSRLPGDRRYAARAEAEKRGVPVTDLVRELFAGELL